nr:hypothetical protein BaRGS_026771 [Batillaria attramentaria]
MARTEMESGGEDGHSFTLGITMNHVKFFEIGFYRWSPGMQTEKLPYGIASNNEDKKVAIIIDGTDNLCELIAFDILHPVSTLRDYLRLLSQYKSVVFHGPINSGKSYLTHTAWHSVWLWVQDLWNTTIASQVREAVKKGTGSDAQSQGQQKVANTALYVLMQRSIVLSCPLSGAGIVPWAVGGAVGKV